MVAIFGVQLLRISNQGNKGQLILEHIFPHKSCHKNFSQQMAQLALIVKKHAKSVRSKGREISKWIMSGKFFYLYMYRYWQVMANRYSLRLIDLSLIFATEK